MSHLKRYKILIVEDDQQISDLLCEYLRKENFNTHPHRSGLGVLEQLQEDVFDLVILDWLLPGRSGVEVCKYLRGQGLRIPVLMLTAKTGLQEKLDGFDAGADDYLTKPFEPSELVARIYAILRRKNSAAQQNETKIVVGHYLIDLSTREAFHKEKKLPVTDKEFELLSVFMKYPGEILTRDHLCLHLHGREWQLTSRSLDILLSRLRNRLSEAIDADNPIRTVWGKGYFFNVEG